SVIARVNLHEIWKRDWRSDVCSSDLALCINHKLRGLEAQLELDYVREVCQKWGVHFIGESIDVTSYKEQANVSTQMAARKLRYDSYMTHIKELNADYLALGHHADDQIETMFMTMSQIARSSSLSGIPVKRSLGKAELIRPLLTVTREDVLDYCRTHHINPKFDPSNEDEHYMRIYYRHHIVPNIKAKHSNIHTTIQHLSESLRDDESYLMSQAKAVFENESVILKDAGHMTVFIDEFIKHPKALQRRMYQLILDYLYSDVSDHFTYVHEQAFLTLLTEDGGSRQLHFPHH